MTDLQRLSSLVVVSAGLHLLAFSWAPRHARAARGFPTGSPLALELVSLSSAAPPAAQASPPQPKRSSKPATRVSVAPSRPTASQRASDADQPDPEPAQSAPQGEADGEAGYAAGFYDAHLVEQLPTPLDDREPVAFPGGAASVLVALTIAADGRVGGVVQESEGSLSERCLREIHGCRFSPAMVHGKRVSTSIDAWVVQADGAEPVCRLVGTGWVVGCRRR